MEPEYSVDAIGYYHAQTYKEEGKKWRPIDIEQGKVVYVDPMLAHRRDKAKNDQNRPLRRD